MTNYIFKRVLLMIPTLLGITLLTFLIIKIAPGNPILNKLQGGEGLSAKHLSMQNYEQLKKLYDLDAPLPQQYGRWLKRIIQLDFGESFKDHRPVLQKIKEALPITLTLNFIEVLIVYLIAVPLGVYSAVKSNSFFDKAVMVGMFFLYALPTFWVAMLLLKFFASGEGLNLFPLAGYASDGSEILPWYQKFLDIAWHLILPITCMVYGSFAFLSRFSRNNLLEVLRSDYIRTARAKGLTERTVLWKHGFRNSLIPLVTLMGSLLPALMGGSVIIEQIFSINGMGKLGFDSVVGRDYPTIMAIASIEAFLTLVSLLIADLAYVSVDPRISFEKL